MASLLDGNDDEGGWNIVEAKSQKRKPQRQQQSQQRQLPVRQRQIIGAPASAQAPAPAAAPAPKPAPKPTQTFKLIDTSDSDSDQPANEPSPTEYEPQWKNFTSAPQSSNRNDDPRSPTMSNGGLVWQFQCRARPRTKSTAHTRDYRMSRPTAKFELPLPYAELKQAIPGSVDKEASFFHYVNEKSGAKIPIPSDNDRFIPIWGPYTQAREAEKILRRIFNTNKTKKSSREKFANTNQKSFAEQELALWMRRQQELVNELREKPDPSERFPESMVFVWPTNELPLQDSFGQSLEALDPLRLEFGYHIYADDELPDCIRVDGDSHHSMMIIVGRLRAKWGELLASRGVNVKLYIPQVPPRRIDVNVEQEVVSDLEMGFPRPVFLALTEQRVEEWKKRGELLRLRNEERLCDSIVRSFHVARFLRGHIRMRVNFGTFMLGVYAPPEGSDVPKYTFESFRSMLFRDSTKGELNPNLQFEHRDGNLIERCLSATHLLRPMNPNISSIRDTKPTYNVVFQFQSEQSQSSSLQLEISYGLSPSSGDPEATDRRWTRHDEDQDGQSSLPLQVGVLDFQRADWELQIKASPFNEVTSIKQSMREFSHSVMLDPGPNRSLGDSRPKVTFSTEDLSGLTRLTETTSLKFRVKDTPYILEIFRRNTYLRAPPRLNPVEGGGYVFEVNQMSETPATTWGARMYDIDWDNTLGAHASFKVGQSANWRPNMKTFFHDPANEEVEERVRLRKFIDVVNEVAEFLAPENKKYPNSSPSAAPPRPHTSTPPRPSPSPVPRQSENDGASAKARWKAFANK